MFINVTYEESKLHTYSSSQQEMCTTTTFLYGRNFWTQTPGFKKDQLCFHAWMLKRLLSVLYVVLRAVGSEQVRKVLKH